MINALHYEPRDQRQRFESGEQQEQDRHIHLHIHLNLTLRARRKRSVDITASRITRIFAALIAATLMPVCLFTQVWWKSMISQPYIMLSYFAEFATLAGLALSWCAVGTLLFATRRSAPYKRFALFLLLMLLPIVAPLFLSWPWFLFLFVYYSLITAFLLMYVSFEARALRQETHRYSRLSFVTVSGMTLALLGGLLYNFSLSLNSPPSVISFWPVMLAAILIAIYTLFMPRKSRKARPKSD